MLMCHADATCHVVHVYRKMLSTASVCMSSMARGLGSIVGRD